MTFEEIERALSMVADTQKRQADNISNMFELIDAQNKQVQEHWELSRQERKEAVADMDNLRDRIREVSQSVQELNQLVRDYLRGIRNGS